MLEFIIVFALGVLIGWRCADAIHTATLSMLLKELGVKEQDLRRVLGKIKPDHDLDPEHETMHAVVGVRLEQEQGQIYAYRKDTAEFLGQGTDAESLIARLNENMQPCRVVVAKEDGADLLQKNNT